MAVKAKASITISHLIDILSVTRYYLLQSSTSAAPVKPTTNPPTGWTVTEPSYTSGSTNTLYFVDCTMFTNDTFKYSEVSKSSSYEAAKEAYNKATAVETRVTNAETQITSNKEAISLRATKTEVTNYVASRGENLVTNGTALLGNNTNFSGFTYDGEDAYYSGGSFKIIARQTMKVSDEYIPVDISQPYTLTYWIKSSSSTGKYYDFLDMYDIDRNRIYDNQVMWVSGSTTTLSEDLNDGDTVVYLQSVSGFNRTSTNNGLHGFIFWNYKNSKGYQYDIHTYSRNTYNSLWDDSSAINTENNTITLKQPWTHGKFLKGVSVSQSNRGSTYSYLNGNYSLTPNVWTEKKGTLNGLGSNGEDGKFREGTAFVRLGWLINYGGEASDVTRVSTISLTQTAGMADLEKIQIGARNLLVGTSIPAAYTKTGATYETDVLYQFSDYCKSITGRNSKQFTLSFEWETTATSGHFEVFGNTAPRVYPTGSIYISPSNQSGKVVRTFTFPGDTETAFSLRCYTLTGTITIKNAMLELANKASSWQPALEDIQFGARNYILNSVFERPMIAYDSGESGWSHPIGPTSATIDSTVTHNGHNTLHKQCTYVDDDTWYESNYYFANKNCIQFSPNESWTLSFWIYASVIPAEPMLSSIRLFNGDWTWANKVCEIPIGDIIVTEVNKWKRLELTFTTLGTIPTYDRGYVMFTNNQTTNCYMTEFKLEKGNATDWTPAPEDVDEDIDNTASDLQTIMREQNDSVIESCNDNINKALGDYVKTGDYEAYKETVTAQLEIMASRIEMNFTTTTESINTTNGTVQNKFDELSKYIRFSSDGIEIGSDTNTLKLTLDNDMIRFERDGDTIGWWDGVDFHTGNIMVDVTERAQFGNFAFIPRSDGSLMFLKVDNIIGGNLFDLKNCEFESNVISYTPIGSTGAHVHITQSTLSSVHFTLDATKTYRISYVAKNALINGYDSSSTPWVKKFEQQGDGMQSITVTGAHEYYFSALEVDDYMFKDVRIVEVS